MKVLKPNPFPPPDFFHAENIWWDLCDCDIQPKSQYQKEVVEEQTPVHFFPLTVSASPIQKYYGSSPTLLEEQQF